MRDASEGGVLLDIYSLRHTFATAAQRARHLDDARERLLGHRPKDTKAMHYEDEDLPLLAAEIAKPPDMLTSPGASGALSVQLYRRRRRDSNSRWVAPRRFSKPLP